MMSWQAKLALEVFWQESVKAGDWQDVQHAASSPEHEDIVLQQPLYRVGKICKDKFWAKCYSVRCKMCARNN